MRLLILTGIFPPDIGGPATQLKYLIPDLIKRGFEISVLTFESVIDFPRTYDNREETNLYRVRRISKKIPQPFRKIVYIITALKMSFGANTVYAWDLYIAGFSGLLLKKIFPRKRFIVRFAGDSAWETARGKGKISDNISEFVEQKYSFSIEFKKWLRKKIMTSADKVIAVSYFLEGIAEKIGVDKRRIKVIYNSVDFFFAEPIGYPIANFHKGVNLITASRLVPWKGQRALVEIMPELIEKYKDIYLWIIGDGPEFQNLKSQVLNLKLQDNVFLTGRLTHAEIFKYLKAADIFVLNTDYEGLSHIILEAMHIGIPVVTTNVCGNPELIEHNKSGFLVKYNDKEQFKKAISELIDNPELSKSFVRESAANLKKFKWENLVEETAGVLRGAS